MTPEVHLIIHNISFTITSLVAIGIALFSLLNNPRRVANITLALMMFSTLIFCISHIWGVNVSDSGLSRSIFTMNISVIFLSLFNTHAVLAILGLDKEKKYMLIIYYIFSFILATFFLVYPEHFLATSEPKMYFPNYYVSGGYDIFMRIFFNVISPIYVFGELLKKYFKSTNEIEKNRLWYFFVAGTVGFVLGWIPIFLLYNIEIDPAWGSLIILYAIPFFYATVKYELMDIKIVAKRAFTYFISILCIGTLIALFNFFNQWLIQTYPGFPFWISPLVSSVATVAIALLVWGELKKGDILKAEFITTVTHKFRTPLTYVKWATDNLIKSDLSEENKAQIGYIRDANEKLVDLTNLLVSVSESENSYEYKLERGNFSKVIENTVNGVIEQMQVKDVTFNKSIQPDLFTRFDITRIKFVIQVFVENAIHYTTQGTIDISLYVEKDHVIFRVKDSGIGISKNELSLLFTKFYRGGGAKLADTEGMGIGLFMSKKIISRHGGKIWAESEGEGKGSSFYFSIPVSR